MLKEQFESEYINTDHIIKFKSITILSIVI